MRECRNCNKMGNKSLMKNYRLTLHKNSKRKRFRKSKAFPYSITFFKFDYIHKPFGKGLC